MTYSLDSLSTDPDVIVDYLNQVFTIVPLGPANWSNSYDGAYFENSTHNLSKQAEYLWRIHLSEETEYKSDTWYGAVIGVIEELLEGDDDRDEGYVRALRKAKILAVPHITSDSKSKQILVECL
jgi:ABC-type branched-subunit amino acid transport system substrate-binding protein